MTVPSYTGQSTLRIQSDFPSAVFSELYRIGYSETDGIENNLNYEGLLLVISRSQLGISTEGEKNLSQIAQLLGFSGFGTCILNN